MANEGKTNKKDVHGRTIYIRNGCSMCKKKSPSTGKMVWYKVKGTQTRKIRSNGGTIVYDQHILGMSNKDIILGNPIFQTLSKMLDNLEHNNTVEDETNIIKYISENWNDINYLQKVAKENILPYELESENLGWILLIEKPEKE